MVASLRVGTSFLATSWVMLALSNVCAWATTPSMRVALMPLATNSALISGVRFCLNVNMSSMDFSWFFFLVEDQWSL